MGTGVELPVDPAEEGVWKPTPENVNALPAPVRRYIHDLEARCDPAGDVRTIAALREMAVALSEEVDELRARLRGSGEEAEVLSKLAAAVVSARRRVCLGCGARYDERDCGCPAGEARVLDRDSLHSAVTEVMREHHAAVGRAAGSRGGE